MISLFETLKAIKTGRSRDAVTCIMARNMRRTQPLTERPAFITSSGEVRITKSGKIFKLRRVR